MDRYISLVTVFCLAIMSICCFAEGDDDKDARFKKIRQLCDQCRETNGYVECVPCLGTGREIKRCYNCNGLGACKKCKGLFEWEDTCPTCIGKGTIKYTRFIPGASNKEPNRYKEEIIQCSRCKGQKKIVIKCLTCKETGDCTTCLGIGFITKRICSTCQGKGQIKCRYCATKGVQGNPVNYPYDLTYEYVLSYINTSVKQIEGATALQREAIKSSFIDEWNKLIADKIVNWEGIVEEIYRIKEANIIALQLRTEETSIRLWIHLRLEDQLVSVSKGNKLGFLIIFPSLVKPSFIRDIDSIVADLSMVCDFGVSPRTAKVVQQISDFPRLTRDAYSDFLEEWGRSYRGPTVIAFSFIADLNRKQGLKIWPGLVPIVVLDTK